MSRFPRWIRQFPATGILLVTLVSVAIAASLFYNGRYPWLYATAGIASILVLAISIVGQRRVHLELGPAGVALAAFAVWTALGISWSVAPYMSVIEVGVAVSALALYVMCRISASGTPEFPVSAFVLVAGILLALTMLVQALIGFVPRAMLFNPNSAAGFLNLAWPIAAVAALRPDADHRARNLAYIAVFAMTTALAIHGSRGAMLGAIVGLLIIVPIGTVVFRRHAAAGTLALTVVTAFVLADLIGGGLVTAGVSSMSSPTLAGTSRLDLWSSAWEMIRQNPWLGFGPGAFWIAYPAFRAATDRSSGYFVHNDYLEFWVEGGLPLLAIVVCLGVACLYLAIRSLRHYRDGAIDRPRFDIALASFAGIASVATHSVVTFNLQLMPFVLVAAMLMAILERASGVSPLVSVSAPARPRGFLSAAVLTGIIMLPVIHFSRTAVALGYIETGAELMARGAYTEAAAMFSRSRLIWGQPDSAWYMHANVLLEAMRANPGASDQHRRDLVARAERLLDSAEQRNPLRSTTSLVRGLLRADHPELTDGTAETALRQAVRLDPRNIEARYALSQLVARKGDRQEALQLVKKGLTIHYRPGVSTQPLRTRVEELESQLDDPSSGTAPLSTPDSERTRSRYY